MNSLSSGNQVVDLVGRMNITGDMAAHAWYMNIKLNGKPDLVAISILARVVYWYKPALKIDEETGAILGQRKKFKSDMLQISYDSIQKSFGFSKKQAREATNRLEDLKIIKKHFRRVESTKGGTLNNVLFIELFPEQLYKYSMLDLVDNLKDELNNDDPSCPGGKEGHALEGNTPHALEGNTPHALEGNTYTKNTNTKISNTKISTKKGFSDKKLNFKKQFASDPNKYELTEPQINMFSSLLAKDDEFCGYHAEPGLSMDMFLKRIKGYLKNPDWVKTNFADLERVGYGKPKE